VIVIVVGTGMCRMRQVRDEIVKQLKLPFYDDEMKKLDTMYSAGNVGVWYNELGKITKNKPKDWGWMSQISAYTIGGYIDYFGNPLVVWCKQPLSECVECFQAIGWPYNYAKAEVERRWNSLNAQLRGYDNVVSIADDADIEEEIKKMVTTPFSDAVVKPSSGKPSKSKQVDGEPGLPKRTGGKVPEVTRD